MPRSGYVILATILRRRNQEVTPRMNGNRDCQKDAASSVDFSSMPIKNLTLKILSTNEYPNMPVDSNSYVAVTIEGTSLDNSHVPSIYFETEKAKADLLAAIWSKSPSHKLSISDGRLDNMYCVDDQTSFHLNYLKIDGVRK